MSITLNQLPPKEFSANARVHYMARYKVIQKAHDDIIALVKEQGWRNPPLGRALVKVHFQLPDRRRRDHDQLVGRMKPYFDGLVHAQVISDDNLDVIGWPQYSSSICPRSPATIITVEAR